MSATIPATKMTTEDAKRSASQAKLQTKTSLNDVTLAAVVAPAKGDVVWTMVYVNGLHHSAKVWLEVDKFCGI